jgi:hypothetical protein
MVAQPALQIEVVVLLGPEHSRERLTVHEALIFGKRPGRDALVEFVGVGDAALEGRVETAERILGPGTRQSQPDGLASAAGNVEDVMRCGLGPRLGGIHRVAPSGDNAGMERILDVGKRVRLAPQALRVALVLGEEQLRAAIALKPVLAQLVVRCMNRARPGCLQRRPAIGLTP